MLHGLRRLTRGHWRARGRLALAVAALVLLGTACSKGTYAVELFPEQHYQQSFKKQEPPRLDPPEGAVPVTGREVALDFETANNTANPLPLTREVVAHGAELFRVNCSMCHGTRGLGDGAVAPFLAAGGAPPANLVAVGPGRSEGQLFWLMSNGGTRGLANLPEELPFIMPTFRLLLDEEDRWSLVHYVRFLAEQGQ